MVFLWFSYGFPMVFLWAPTFLALRLAPGAVSGHAGPCGAAGAAHGHGVWAPQRDRDERSVRRIGIS